MAMRNSHRRVCARGKPEAGFTLLEVMIATVILGVGMLGLLGFFVTTIANMNLSQEEMIAKQKAHEALESLLSARNTQQLTFDSIANVSNGGVFLDDFQPINVAGPDGIIGTLDDGPLETLVYPGPDGILGTDDDVRQPLSNFQRKIEIVPVLHADGSKYADLRQVNVTIRYWAPQYGQRSYTVSSYVSRYR